VTPFNHRRHGDVIRNTKPCPELAEALSLCPRCAPEGVVEGMAEWVEGFIWWLLLGRVSFATIYRRLFSRRRHDDAPISFPPRIAVRGGNPISLVPTLLRLQPQLLIKL
jgi:hypothetical protein